jgi:tetratricopeptide (TPR) repeat protein
VDELIMDEAEPETAEQATLRLLDALARNRIVERSTGDATVTPRYRVPDQVLAYARRELSRTGLEHGPRARQALTLADTRRQSRNAYETLAESVRSMERGDMARSRDLARDCVLRGRATRDRLEARGLAALAELQVELGSTRDAEVLLRIAATLRNGGSDSRAERCLAKIDRRRRKLKDALERLASLAKDQGDDTFNAPIERVRALRELAVVQAERHQTDEGVAATVIAETLAERLSGDGAELLPGLLWARGRVLRCAEDFDGADSVLRRADDAATETGQWLWLAWIRHEQGKVAFGQSDFASSRQHAKTALGDFTRMSHRYGGAYCLLLLGEALEADNRIPEASQVLDQALATFQRCGDAWIEASTARALARVRLREHRRSEALPLLRNAKQTFAELDDRSSESGVRRLQARTLLVPPSLWAAR